MYLMKNTSTRLSESQYMHMLRRARNAGCPFRGGAMGIGIMLHKQQLLSNLVAITIEWIKAAARHGSFCNLDWHCCVWVFL